MKNFILLLFSFLLVMEASARKPLTVEQHAKIQTRIENIRQALKVPKEPAAKRKLLENALTKENIHEARRGLLPLVDQLPASEWEPFLLGVLKNVKHADVWDLCVERLKTKGSPKSIKTLLACTTAQTGKLAWPSARSIIMARREAIFTLAEIGQRHPNSRPEIIKGLKTLKFGDRNMIDPPKQALYLLTKDPDYLKPFFKRLESPDPEVRASGVVAFRFLKLTVPPVEIVRALEDPHIRVRTWAALVLGEIGDPESINLLLRAAENEKEEYGVRANAIGAIGRIGPRARKAVPVLEKLISGEDLDVHAAIALSRITGVRHRLVPEGYRLNPQAK